MNVHRKAEREQGLVTIIPLILTMGSCSANMKLTAHNSPKHAQLPKITMIVLSLFFKEAMSANIHIWLKIMFV